MIISSKTWTWHCDNDIVVVLRLGNHILQSVLIVSNIGLWRVTGDCLRLYCTVVRLSYILIIVVESLNSMIRLVKPNSIMWSPKIRDRIERKEMVLNLSFLGFALYYFLPSYQCYSIPYRLAARVPDRWNSRISTSCQKPFLQHHPSWCLPYSTNFIITKLTSAGTSDAL